MDEPAGAGTPAAPEPGAGGGNRRALDAHGAAQALAQRHSELAHAVHQPETGVEHLAAALRASGREREISSRVDSVLTSRKRVLQRLNRSQQPASKRSHERVQGAPAHAPTAAAAAGIATQPRKSRRVALSPALVPTNKGEKAGHTEVTGHHAGAAHDNAVNSCTPFFAHSSTAHAAHAEETAAAAAAEPLDDEELVLRTRHRNGRTDRNAGRKAETSANAVANANGTGANGPAGAASAQRQGPSRARDRNRKRSGSRRWNNSRRADGTTRPNRAPRSAGPRNTSTPPSRQKSKRSDNYHLQEETGTDEVRRAGDSVTTTPPMNAMYNESCAHGEPDASADAENDAELAMAPPEQHMMIKDDPRKNLRLHRQARTVVQAPSTPNDPHATLSQIQLTLCALESQIEELQPAAEEALRKKQHALAERQRAEAAYQAKQSQHTDKMLTTVLRLIGETSKSDAQKQQEVRVTRRATFLRRYCRPILRELMCSRWGYIFNQPVDADKLGLPDYHTIITHPMDLGTVLKRIDRAVDYTPEQVAEDVRLTFNNATTYNPKGHVVHGAAQELLQRFEDAWARRVKPYLYFLDEMIQCDMAVIREGDKMAYYDQVHNEATAQVEAYLERLEKRASDLAECKAQLRSMCRSFPESQLRWLTDRLNRLHPTLADKVADITLDDPNSGDLFPSSETMRLDLASLDTVTLSRLQHLMRVSTYAQWAPHGAGAVAFSAIFEDEMINTGFPTDEENVKEESDEGKELRMECDAAAAHAEAANDSGIGVERSQQVHGDEYILNTNGMHVQENNVGETGEERDDPAQRCKDGKNNDAEDVEMNGNIDGGEKQEEGHGVRANGERPTDMNEAQPATTVVQGKEKQEIMERRNGEHQHPCAKEYAAANTAHEGIAGK